MPPPFLVFMCGTRVVMLFDEKEKTEEETTDVHLLLSEVARLLHNCFV